jgi:hypothetical protein
MFLGGCLGRNNKLAQMLTNYPPQRGFYVPQVSINCLACPKGFKYKLISDAQAILRKILYTLTILTFAFYARYVPTRAQSYA